MKENYDFRQYKLLSIEIAEDAAFLDAFASDVDPLKGRVIAMAAAPTGDLQSMPKSPFFPAYSMASRYAPLFTFPMFSLLSAVIVVVWLLCRYFCRKRFRRKVYRTLTQFVTGQWV